MTRIPSVAQIFTDFFIGFISPLYNDNLPQFKVTKKTYDLCKK
jgi:hypothetical protein